MNPVRLGAKKVNIQVMKDVIEIEDINMLFKKVRLENEMLFLH